jgi:uncharacterized protein (TIGR03086 family)
MTEPIDLFRRATTAFGRHVHAIGADQWHDPTPCTEWDVRMLVNHVAVEQLWVPPLVDGMHVSDIGSDLDDDQLGQAPIAAWDAAVAASSDAFGAAGALEGTVDLSSGPRPAAEYCWEMTVDALIHSWDLARAIGADETLDPELVGLVYERILPMVEQLQQTGMYAPPVAATEDDPLQTRLLALFGRAERP